MTDTIPTGRNDPCPCGSGKKYKRCCLDKRQTPKAGGERRHAAGIALSWLQSHYRAAHAKAVDDFLSPLIDEDGRPSPYAKSFQGMIDINLGEFLLADALYETEQGLQLAIDLLDNGPEFSDEQWEWLVALSREPLLLFEVVDVRPDEGLVLRDTLEEDSEEIFVREKAGTRGMESGMFLGARVIDCEGEWLLSGAFFPFESGLGLHLATTIDGLLPEFEEDSIGVSLAVAAVITRAWLMSVAAPPERPEILDADGEEPVMLTNEHYQVLDMDRLREALSRQPDVIYDPRIGWRRIEESPKGDRPPRFLGAVEFTKAGNRIQISTWNLKAADEAKEWFESLAGDAVRHLARDFTDPAYLFQDQDSAGRSTDRIRDELGLSPEESTEHRQHAIERVHVDWADTRIRALDDRTPRDSLDSETGRTQLMRLLRFYEQNERASAQREGRPPVSYEFLFEQLGLDFDLKR